MTAATLDPPPRSRRLHPLPLRAMHWTNALAILVMIGSGITIYSDQPLFAHIHFPAFLAIGGEPETAYRLHGDGGFGGALLWHFAAMWLLVLNGIAYLVYGIATGRFRRMLLPLRIRDIVATARDALRFNLGHDDLTMYNAVQKILYIGVIALIVVQGGGRSRTLEARAVFDAGGIAGRVRGRSANPLPRHDGHLCVSGDPRPAGAAGAAHLACDGDRRPQGRASDGDEAMTAPTYRAGQAVLADKRKLVEAIDRRKILRGALSLGALTALTGCDVTDQDSVNSALQKVSGWNDRVQSVLFDPNKLAPTYAKADVIRPPRFNAFYDLDEIDPVDLDEWRLEFTGAVAAKTPWMLKDVRAMQPKSMIIRHVCVEGWNYIGDWSGPTLKSILEKVGADLTAKFVGFHCADKYVSLDRHGDGAASADPDRDRLRRSTHHRSVRLAGASAHLDQARVQEPEMDHRDRGDQHEPRRVLGRPRLQLVRGSCRSACSPSTRAGSAALAWTSTVRRRNRGRAHPFHCAPSFDAHRHAGIVRQPRSQPNVRSDDHARAGAPTAPRSGSSGATRSPAAFGAGAAGARARGAGRTARCSAALGSPSRRRRRVSPASPLPPSRRSPYRSPRTHRTRIPNRYADRRLRNARRKSRSTCPRRARAKSAIREPTHRSAFRRRARRRSRLRHRLLPRRRCERGAPS